MKYLIFCFFGMSLMAQEKPHELSLHAGGGLTHLNYGAISTPGAGTAIGLGYRYYWSPQWSLGTGAELQLYQSQARLATASGSSDARDAEGSDFQFRYEAKNYREKQQAYYLSLPLNLQFETPTRGTSWYMNIGGKAAFNFRGQYRASVPELSTTGYYPEWNAILADPAFMGFGEWSNARSEKKDWKSGTAFLVTAETGLKWPDLFINYLGIYADYGLNNILETAPRKALIGYITDQPDQFSYTSVVAATDGQGTPLVRKMNLFSAGIRIRIVLN